MKNIYLLLLSIAISAGLLTGCGNDKKPPVEQQKKATAEAQQSPAARTTVKKSTEAATPKEGSEKSVAAKVEATGTEAAKAVENMATTAEKVTETVQKSVAKAEKRVAKAVKAAPAPTAKEPVKAKAAPAVPTVSKESIKLGGSIFKARCVACHGTNGRGSTMAPGFVGNKWVSGTNDAEIAAVIKDGRRGGEKQYKKFPIPMPGHPSMPDNELSALVNYLKSLN